MRRTSSRIIGWLGVVTGGVLVVTGLATGGLTFITALGFAIAAFSYTALAAPLLRIDARGLTARNVVHEVHLPWGSIARAHASGNLVVDDVEGTRTVVWGVALQRSGVLDFLRAGLKTHENLRFDLARVKVDRGDTGQPDSWRPVPGSMPPGRIHVEALPDVINAECADNDATTSERTVRWLAMPAFLIAVALVLLVVTFILAV